MSRLFRLIAITKNLGVNSIKNVNLYPYQVTELDFIVQHYYISIVIELSYYEHKENNKSYESAF